MPSIIITLLVAVIGIALGWLARWLYAKVKLTSIEQKAARLDAEAEKQAEAKKNELVLETRKQLLDEQRQQEREARERQADLQRTERRLQDKEEALDKRQSELERTKTQLGDRENALNTRDKELVEKENSLTAELEKIASMSSDEAKNIIMKQMEDAARHDAQVSINKIEDEAKLTADKKAREIVVTAIQHCASDVTGDTTVASVSLPSDEMKGRIIGREGRNIRALETLTGVDVIIDDTPEAVVISSFDPVRREIARVSLERLVQDGRIHPGRIEEVVEKVTKEVSRVIMDQGETVVFDLGINNISQEMVRALGRLYFRTSYGQNVLNHSKEVAILAGTIASEVGADSQLALRAGLLHDIGKGIESESEQNHAELGADLARRLGEDPKVVNAILAHHNDVEPETLEAVIVQIADAISASRPGARRETIETYIKRLESLEKIAKSFDGVDDAYAIQAGRELRIMVNNEKVSDEKAKEIAKQIAERIEAELRYPGRIKVTIIRETRVIEYAK